MNQLLLDGAPVAGVRWDTGSATFTLPKTKPGGGAWGANDAVRLQLIVDGVASKEVILVVGPPPSLDDGQSPSGAPSTDVTVTGTNLGSVAGTVQVNRRDADVKAWAADAVTFTIPAKTAKGMAKVQLIVHGHATNAVDLRVD